MKKKELIQTEFIFFIALAIYMLAKTIELSTAFSEISYMPQVMKLLRYTSYIIVFIKLIYDSIYVETEFVKIILIFCLLGLVSLSVSNNILFCSFFFIVAARNISLSKLIYVTFWIQISLTLAIVLASQVGIISDWVYDIEGRNRHSLGYIYPSYIASIFFYMTLTYIFIRKEKLKLLEIAIIELINCLVFLLTDSKTSFALASVVLIVLWIIKFYRKQLKNNFISKIIYVYSVFVIAIISILACLFYNNENSLFVKLNAFVNNRLFMGHNALLEYGLSLFGKKIQWIGYGGLGHTISKLQGEYNFVDCSYVKILLDYGSIFFIIMLTGYAIVSYRAIKKKDRYLCLCILFMCIYSIIEPRIIEFGFNPFVLSLSVLFGKNILDSDEKCLKRLE